MQILTPLFFILKLPGFFLPFVFGTPRAALARITLALIEQCILESDLAVDSYSLSASPLVTRGVVVYKLLMFDVEELQVAPILPPENLSVTPQPRLCKQEKYLS